MVEWSEFKKKKKDSSVCLAHLNISIQNSLYRKMKKIYATQLQTLHDINIYHIRYTRCKLYLHFCSYNLNNYNQAKFIRSTHCDSLHVDL